MTIEEAKKEAYSLVDGLLGSPNLNAYSCLLKVIRAGEVKGLLPIKIMKAPGDHVFPHQHLYLGQPGFELHYLDDYPFYSFIFCPNEDPCFDSIHLAVFNHLTVDTWDSKLVNMDFEQPLLTSTRSNDNPCQIGENFFNWLQRIIDETSVWRLKNLVI